MELYSTTIADRCLGSYLSRPELILDSNYPVRKEDFVSQFHQIVYVTLYNLYTSGCQSFSLMDINEYLKPYEAQYNIYKDSDGDNYIQVITELTDPDNFDYYYEQLRKFSCLRMYREKGYDIDTFYDVTKSEESQLENLNKYTIQDIINHYDGINLDIRQEFLSGMTETECNEAGEGLDEFLDRLSETPLYGVSFLSDMLNAATRGLMDGQLTCFSSPSGIGKTSVACGLTALLCAPRYWDSGQGKFVDNPHKTRNGASYVQYELDNITELSPKFLAFITDIPVSKMLDNDLTDEERARLKEGSKILKESNIHMVYMPDFTRQSIDDTVKQHIIKYGIDFLVMDYISDVPSLNAEMVKANGGVGLRTDQVLAGFSSFLKDIARKYNIPVYTMTQTNANLGTEATVGAESISGSRAVANKLDIGGVFLNLRPKEEKAYEEIKTQIVQRGFGHKMCDPTHIYHMYKTRFGSLPQNVKIWVNFNNGTCRMVDCFCTDWQNKLLKVTPVELVKLVNKEVENKTPVTVQDIEKVF